MGKMKFEEFRMWAGEAVKMHLPEEFGGVKPHYEVIRKHSACYNGMVLRPSGALFASVVNMDEFYERYKNEEPPETILTDMAKIIMTRPPSGMKHMGKVLDYNFVRDNMYVRICSREEAGDRLEDCPVMTVDDLVLTFNIRMKYSEDSYGSIMIDNALLKHYGVSAEQLRDDALKSSAKLCPACYMSMREIAGGSFDCDLPVPDCIGDMLVVSDQYSKAGSAVIFYPDLLDRIGNKLGSDFYLLPYAEKCTLAFAHKYEDSLDEYLNFISATYNIENDGKILSHSLYFYDREQKQMMVTSDRAF